MAWTDGNFTGAQSPWKQTLSVMFKDRFKHKCVERGGNELDKGDRVVPANPQAAARCRDQYSKDSKGRNWEETLHLWVSSWIMSVKKCIQSKWVVLFLMWWVWLVTYYHVWESNILLLVSFVGFRLLAYQLLTGSEVSFDNEHKELRWFLFLFVKYVFRRSKINSPFEHLGDWAEISNVIEELHGKSKR